MNIDKEQRATVWDIEKDDRSKKTYVGRISTYEGENADGDKVYSSWYAKFRGKAYKAAADLKNGDFIVLDLAKVESQYNKKNKTSFVSVTVFDFHIWEDQRKGKKKKAKKADPEDDDFDE